MGSPRCLDFSCDLIRRRWHGCLASKLLPIYKVTAPAGTEAFAQPAFEADMVEKLPKNALVLIHERIQRDEMWWLRLAVGGVWILEDVMEEVRMQNNQEAKDWLQKMTTSSSGGLALQNAQAVVDHLSK